MLGMSTETILKMAFNMAKGQIQKSPTGEIRFNEADAKKFLKDNVPELKLEVEQKENGIEIVIKKS